MAAVLSQVQNTALGAVHRFLVAGRAQGQGVVVSRPAEAEIPPEADRVLTIWRQWTLADPGTVGRGYPAKSAGFSGGGYFWDFDEEVSRCDKRAGAIADAILWDMSKNGHSREVLAIWNKYLARVVKFRGDEPALLVDGCRVFLIEARRRGIAE